MGGSVGKAGTLGGVRGEGDAVPDATELRRDTRKPGVVGDGWGDRRRSKDEIGVELCAASGSRVRFAIEGRRRAMRREGGGEDPIFRSELSSPWTEWIVGISNEEMLPRRTYTPVSAPYGAYRAPRDRNDGPTERVFMQSGASITIAGELPSECSLDGGEERAHSVVLEKEPEEELRKEGGVA